MELVVVTLEDYFGDIQGFIVETYFRKLVCGVGFRIIIMNRD